MSSDFFKNVQHVKYQAKANTTEGRSYTWYHENREAMKEAIEESSARYHDSADYLIPVEHDINVIEKLIRSDACFRGFDIKIEKDIKSHGVSFSW